MKIKLDENLPAEPASLLETQHHDVHTVYGERLVGVDDKALFEAAVLEGRMFVTQDLDFSDVKVYPGNASWSGSRAPA